MPTRQRAAGDLFGTRSAPDLPADAAVLPEAPASPTGPPAGQAAPRYQWGARITDDLWLRFRAESRRSGDPYGVVLGRAYNRHAAEVAPPPTVVTPPADDAFGVSISEVTRQLFDRYLSPHSPISDTL